MRSPLKSDDPAIIAYLAALERLDDEGWDRLVRVGRAALREWRTHPKGDALRALVGLPEEWEKAELAAKPCDPFEGTLVDAGDSHDLVAVYEGARQAAFLAYSAARPQVYDADEDPELPEAMKRRSGGWAEPMDKATRIAAQGAVLLSMKDCRHEWTAAWGPWQALVDSIPEPQLFHGDWAGLFKVAEVPEPPQPSGALGRIFGRSEPRFGAATAEVDQLLLELPRVDDAGWDRLEELLYNFATTSSLSDGAVVRALVPVVDLGSAMRGGDRFWVDNGHVASDKALAAAGLEREKRHLLRAFAAASLACGSDDADRMKAAGMAACLLVMRRNMTPDDWNRIWGGPLESQAATTAEADDSVV
jgi:hypothetical protein